MKSLLSKTFFKAKRRIVIKLKYFIGKSNYLLQNITGVTKRSKSKILLKNAANYELKVFTSRSLDEITDIIKNDKPFFEAVTEAGDRACNDEWLVLNEYRKGMFDVSKAHYRWTEDFFTGFCYSDCFYQDSRKQKASPNTDIKIPWESSRMQSLFALSLAYRATKDEKYAKKVKEIIIDFDKCCPCGHGVNWNVSMEVGIRISNILLACELIWDSDVFDSNFKKLVAMIVYEHMNHIRKNMENEKNGGNHLLADILGLAAASSAMPFLPKAKKYSMYVQKMLHREIMRQILPDGSHFEGSVSYHRLVGEIVCFSIKAQEKMGFSLTAKERERLFKMGEFTAALRMDNGLVPQLGDNDSGRVFQLFPENTRDHDSFINLVSFITDKSVAFPDKKDGFFCFYNKDTIYQSLFPQTEVAEFPCFKLLRYRKNGIFFTLCGATPESYDKSGHSHNDVLSFTLAAGKNEIVTDPGSGEYTGNNEIRHKMRSVKNHSSLSVDGGEQRIFPKNPFLSFGWSTSVKSSLEFFVKNSGETVFTGECNYKNEKDTVITQKRNVTITESSIEICDRVFGMENEYSISLPLFPKTDVSITDEKVILQSEDVRVCVEGEYEFSVLSSLFATQYKKLEPCKIIKCKSKNETNLLKITIS